MRPEIGSSGKNTPNSSDEGEAPQEIRHRQHKAGDRIDRDFAARPENRVPNTASAMPSRTAMRRRQRQPVRASPAAGRESARSRSGAADGDRRNRRCSTWPHQITNCDQDRLVEPVERAQPRRSSASSAPGGIIIATGSPGTTRTSTNTSTATPASVGTACSSRNRMRRSSTLQSAAAANAAASPPLGRRGPG